MRILGIDPGYGRLGWSIIDTDLRLIDYGVIETVSDDCFDDRLLSIHQKLQTIIERHRPDAAAIEKLYFARNTTTALDVAKAIGVVVLTIRLAGLCYQEYTPSQVKCALTGYGRATKEQMQKMIMMLFKLAEVPRPDDAADALAVATCHSLGSRIATR